jgi:large subunit ribosomal protein L25
MKTVAVAGKIRSAVGKKAAKAVRNNGEIPCVLYGGGKEIHFSTTLKEVKDLIYSPDFKLAEINLDGQSYKGILKETQFHPVTDEIVHVDFLQLVEGRKIKVEIPIKFTGTSAGLKSGGKLLQNVRRVKIKTTPEHLVDELTLDISSLGLGQSIRVRDIATHKGIEILNSPGIPLATVEIPRALRSATAAAEEGEEEVEATAGEE